MMHLIPSPSGGFAFVGKVPSALAFVCSDPALLETAAHCGPGFAMKAAKRAGKTFAPRTFETPEAANAAALEWAGSPEELAKHYAPKDLS